MGNLIVITQTLIASGVWAILITICYAHSGWRNIKECYGMWFTKDYWSVYNTVEFISWTSKAFIIIPGLVLGIQIWELYYITLITSLSLIWASHKKSLPTLVGFNTVWVWLSVMVIVQHWAEYK